MQAMAVKKITKPNLEIISKYVINNNCDGKGSKNDS